MAKKGKRKKSGEVGQAGVSVRPEAAAAESSNVIQFPAKGARLAGATTQIAIGSGTVVAHDADDGESEDEGARASVPPAAEPAAKEAALARDATDAPAPQRRRHSTPTPSRGLAAVRADGTVASTTGEHAAVSDDFFGAELYPTQDTGEPENWDDLKIAEPISASTRRAMVATAAILGGFLLLGGAYLFVQKVVMPQPEQLGGPPPVATLPTPIAAPEPAEAPFAAPPAPVAPPDPALADPALADPALAAAPVEGEAIPEGVAPPTDDPTAPTEAPAAAPAAVAAVVPPAAAPPVAAPAVAAPAVAAPAAATGDVASLLEAAKQLRGARKLAALNDLAAANPSNAEVLAVLGFEYLQRSDNRRALEFAARAVAIDPTSSQGWITVGSAQGGLGNRAASQAAYRSCAERGQGRFVRDCRAMR